jgi:hypothetical protein
MCDRKWPTSRGRFLDELSHTTKTHPHKLRDGSSLVTSHHTFPSSAKARRNRRGQARVNGLCDTSSRLDEANL